MNSKFIYGAALSALMLSACSQDSVLDMPSTNNDAIAFSVTNGASTRALESQCNTNMPKNFKVSAYKAGTTENYFAADEWTRESQSPLKYNGLERYWPEYNLDFHAWANDGGTYQYNEEKGVGEFVNFAPKTDVKEQLDLLYAGMTNQTRQTVKLNFRHALSQIVFNARNENTRLNISVSGVTVGHLNGNGTYTMVNADTDDNYENHTNVANGNEDVILKGQGAWVLNDQAVNEYTTSFNSVDLSTDNQPLTTVNHNGGTDGSLLLLPQTQDAWNPDVKEDSYNGAYFLLDVVIMDGDKEVYNGKTALPVSIDWKQGVRYIYTFVFTDGGNGGYTPNPDDPKPTISGVKYEITTDDFVPVDPTEVPDTPAEEPQPEVKNNFSISVNNGEEVLYTQSVEVAEDTYTFNIPVIETPEKEGYTFAGWLCSLDGQVYQALPGSVTATKGNANAITYNAQWTENPKEVTYKVTFDKNMEDQNVYFMPEDIEVTNADGSYTFTLPKDGPQTNGVFCHGWTIVKDDANIDYKNGDTVTLTPENNEITLYVAWRQGTPSGGSGDIIGTDPTVKP